jgi:hypothetical protein
MSTEHQWNGWQVKIEKLREKPASMLEISYKLYWN